MKFSYFTITLISFFIIGCSTSNQEEDDPRDLLLDGVAYAETDNATVTAVAVHENGDWYGVLSNGFNNEVNGAVYTHRNGETLVVYFDQNGFPERAYSEGYIFLYRNYRQDMVDVAVIDPSGEIQITRDVYVDTGLLENVAYKTPSSSVLGTAENLRLASIGLSTAVCVTAVIASAGVAAIPCGVALLGAGVALLPGDNPAIESSASAIGIGAAAIGCGTFEPFSCATLVAEVGAAIATAAEEDIDEREQIVESAEGALDTGSGDVQVTLTWNNTADLDLWVTDPSGELIYFGNSSSQSGGQLDRDDVDGFGPENIFWPTGEAPSGEYIVQVDHFSGGQAANYTVLVQAFGNSKSYSGTIPRDQTITVTTFSDSGIALIAQNEICQTCASIKSTVTKE